MLGAIFLAACLVGIPALVVSGMRENKTSKAAQARRASRALSGRKLSEVGVRGADGVGLACPNCGSTEFRDGWAWNASKRFCRACGLGFKVG
jgi:hypothetical protein